MQYNSISEVKTKLILSGSVQMPEYKSGRQQLAKSIHYLKNYKNYQWPIELQEDMFGSRYVLADSIRNKYKSEIDAFGMVTKTPKQMAEASVVIGKPVVRDTDKTLKQMTIASIFAAVCVIVMIITLLISIRNDG